MNRLYSDIFTENVADAVVLPLGGSLTLDAMRLFGGFDMQAAALFALAGAAIGYTLNWLFGLLLERVRHATPETLPEARYRLAQGYAKRYLPFLLPFSFLPFGGLLSLLAGFFHLRGRIVLPLTVAGYAVRLALA